MSNRQQRLATIAEFLRQETTLALATVEEHGQPCATPLFYIVDESLSLYWLSSADSAHSRNLQSGSRVAATVYRHAANWREIRGVQMRGSAQVVSDPLRRKALVDRYCERFALSALFRPIVAQSVLYELRPDFFRYLDNSRRFGYKFELFTQL